MFGYATNGQYMPSRSSRHRLARTLARYRKQENVSWLRPDSKTQVMSYENGRPVRVTDVLVSTMHAPDVTQTRSAVRRDDARAGGNW